MNITKIIGYTGLFAGTISTGYYLVKTIKNIKNEDFKKDRDISIKKKAKENVAILGLSFMANTVSTCLIYETKKPKYFNLTVYDINKCVKDKENNEVIF